MFRNALRIYTNKREIRHFTFHNRVKFIRKKEKILNSSLCSFSKLIRFIKPNLHSSKQQLLDVCLSVHRCICVEMKNQLDVTEWFIALMISSACFGHFYVHHQELGTMCMLLPPMVCCAWLLVVGGQVQDNRLCVQVEGCCTTAVEHPSS